MYFCFKLNFMAKIPFFLDNKNKEISAIKAIPWIGGKGLKLSIGVSVKTKYWDSFNYRVRARKEYQDAITINEQLDKWEELILKVLNDFKVNLITPDLKAFRQAVDEEIKAKHIEAGIVEEFKKKSSLFEHVEQVIANREANKKIGRDGRDGRLNKYRQAYNRLKQFAKENYKRDLEFDDIDLNFYYQYISFLRNLPVKNGKAEMPENSIGQEIKILKRFLNLADIQGINTKSIFKSREFKAPQKQVTPIYLDEEEINKIYNKELHGHLDSARDLFIIGCRTSLRISDYSKVENSIGGDLICVSETEKTEEPAYIPIHWQVQEILDKYEGKLPRISDQKLNEYIKKVCELAEINNIVFDNRQGQRKKWEKCPKWELITTHTGRRSCITNMYFAGFDLFFLMSLTGHKSIDTLLRYIGVTKKANAIRIKDNPYFKKEKIT